MRLGADRSLPPTAYVIHGDEATCKAHEEVGFLHGRGTVIDQMVAHIKAGAS